MGFNTAVVVLNDALDSIRSDAEIGERIDRAIMLVRREGGDVSAHGKNAVHVNAIRVLPPQHADYVQIVAVGGNTIRNLGWSMKWEPEDLLRDLADHLGYSLRKKKPRL